MTALEIFSLIRPKRFFVESHPQPLYRARMLRSITAKNVNQVMVMSARTPVRQALREVRNFRRQRTALQQHRHLVAAFSILNRSEPKYEGHIPLTTVERVGMAVGSALGALWNPRRADLIATCGETTATPYFIYRLRDAMLRDPTGRRILRDRPRISSKTLSLEHLRTLPENSVGRTYAAWLDREGVTPDTRLGVRYIDDEECAYVMQRYRECHDFYHALVGLPIFHEGEVALKAFEFANTGLPMTGMAVFSALRMKKEEKERFWNIYFPWAVRNGSNAKDIINVYWEEQLERDVGELRRELGIENPPDLRAIRKKIRDDKKAAKARVEGEKNENIAIKHAA